MHPPVSDAAWAAMRELRAKEPPTYARLSAISGLHIATIRDRAARDNWPKPNFQSRRFRDAWAGRDLAASEAAFATSVQDADLLQGETTEEAVSGLKTFITRWLQQMVATARQSGRAPDKASIDTLSAMQRMVEKIGETTRAEEHAKDNKKITDEDVAAALARIDGRIFELACELAARMGPDELRRRTGDTDR